MALIRKNINGEKELNELWHRRMRHLHHKALRMLKETIFGVPILNIEHDDLHRGCVLGNYTKEAFSRSKNRVEGVLGLIHLYICNIMSTRALIGDE